MILAIQISRQIERNQPNTVSVDEIMSFMTKGKVDQGLGVERQKARRVDQRGIDPTVRENVENVKKVEVEEEVDVEEVKNGDPLVLDQDHHLKS